MWGLVHFSLFQKDYISAVSETCYFLLLPSKYVIAFQPCLKYLGTKAGLNFENLSISYAILMRFFNNRRHLVPFYAHWKPSQLSYIDCLFAPGKYRYCYYVASSDSSLAFSQKITPSCTLPSTRSIWRSCVQRDAKKGHIKVSGGLRRWNDRQAHKWCNTSSSM